MLINAEKPSRERLTLVWIFEALHGIGYAGGYDAVRRDARALKECVADLTLENRLLKKA